MVDKRYALVCKETGMVKNVIVYDEDTVVAESAKYDKEVDKLKAQKKALLNDRKRKDMIEGKIRRIPIPIKPFQCPDDCDMVELQENESCDHRYERKSNKFSMRDEEVQKIQQRQLKKERGQNV